METCIFCKIINGDVPCDKVYEDDKTLAFLDLNPVARGHTLVIPKKHFETMDEMDEETAAAVIETTQKIARAVLKFNDGYNVNQNNKPEAGQVVPHVHYHIVPRNSGDGLHYCWNKIDLSEKEIDEVKVKIQTFLK
ncbi:HIT family protein [archaeon]|nr:HIT family protein [archaeon]